MTESKICTCPSGDGSLVHPCPAHPAPVEQAGANVGHGHVFPRADGVKMRCGGPGLCSECTADAYRARAALAQPSPAPDLAERGTTTEQTCRHDFYGVWWNRNGVTKTGRECRYCGFFVEDATEAPAEQAEAERPEVVAVMESNGAGGKRLAQRFPIVNVFVGDELMTVAQHDRIVGALRFERQQMDSAFTACINERDSWAKRWDEAVKYGARIEEQRDAALAEIAELEKKLAMTSDAASKGDAARHAAGGMEMEIQELKAKLADAQAGRQAGRREQSAYELLRQALKLMPLGTKKRAEWVGRTSDLLCIAQAQHSVPEISGIGRDAEHPRAVVLYLRNEPSDEDMRAIQNFLRAMLAAAPGKEDNA